MRRARGPCGWCLTGDCCETPGSRAARLIDCTHCGTCRIYHEEGVMPAGPSIIQQIWSQLDEEVDEIVDIGTQQQALVSRRIDGDTSLDDQLLRNDIALATAKGRARGKAEALALLMPPYFRTADEISQEASARKAHRDAGQPYVSPGLSRDSLGHRLQHTALVDQALHGLDATEGAPS